MSSRPTLVFVPGSFCFGDTYEAALAPLRAKGYDIEVLEPPCYPAGYKRGSDGAPPNMYADARYINEHVTNLANEGKEVVLLAHSYGGTCFQGV
jgi:pimeloyl-ACP methyl ester carboxylesterase